MARESRTKSEGQEKGRLSKKEIGTIYHLWTATVYQKTTQVYIKSDDHV